MGFLLISSKQLVVSMSSSEMCRKTPLRIIFCGLCGLHDEKQRDSDIVYCLCVTLRDLLCVYTVKPKDDPNLYMAAYLKALLFIYWLTNCI